MGVLLRWEATLKVLVTLAALAATAYGFSAYFVVTRAAHGETAEVQRAAHGHLASADHEHQGLQKAVAATGSAVEALGGRVSDLEQTQRDSHAEVARYLQEMSCVVVDRGVIRPGGGCSRRQALLPIRPLAP